MDRWVDMEEHRLCWDRVCSPRFLTRKITRRSHKYLFLHRRTRCVRFLTCWTFTRWPRKRKLVSGKVRILRMKRKRKKGERQGEVVI